MKKFNLKKTLFGNRKIEMNKQVLVISPYKILDYEKGYNYFMKIFGTKLIEIHTANGNNFNRISMTNGMNGILSLINDKMKFKSDYEKLGGEYFIVVVTPLKSEDYLKLMNVSVPVYLIKLDNHIIPNVVPKNFILSDIIPEGIFSYTKKVSPKLNILSPIELASTPYKSSIPTYSPPSYQTEKFLSELEGNQSSLRKRRDYELEDLDLGRKRRFEGDEYNRYPNNNIDNRIHVFTGHKVKIDSHRQILSTFLEKIMDYEVRRIDGIWDGYKYVRPARYFCKIIENTIYLSMEVNIRKMDNIRDLLEEKDKGKVIYYNGRPTFKWDYLEGNFYY